MTRPITTSPETWLLQLQRTRAATSGGVIRRRVREVERIVGRSDFHLELKRRGWHAVENAGEFIIFCNREPVRIFA